MADWRELTGPRIRALRERLGLGQTDFGALVAEEVGVWLKQEVDAPHQSTVSRWEAGGQLGPLWGGAILRMEATEARVRAFMETEIGTFTVTLREAGVVEEEERGGGQGGDVQENDGLGGDQSATTGGGQGVRLVGLNWRHDPE